VHSFLMEHEVFCAIFSAASNVPSDVCRTTPLRLLLPAWGCGQAKHFRDARNPTMTIRPLSIMCLGLMVAMVSPLSAQTAKKKTATPKPAAEPAQPAVGSGPKLVSQYGDWGVYVSQAKSKICYALGEPKDRKPAGLKRDPAYIFISSRPSENVRDEVSIIAGYAMKDGSDATLVVGGMSFPFYAKNDGAWVRNAAEEAKLVEALRKNRDFTVKGSSTRDNVTTDRYSLSGISQALDRVAQECK
jgi:invasion protein IalB